EHTAYYIKALSKDLPKVVELLGDIVQNCSLEDSQIEKERDVILREMQENDASMRDVVFDYLHATAFQGTPLAQTVEGPSENVRKLSRADLTEYLGNTTAGLDMREGTIGDMAILGITESFQVKRQVLLSAAEAAEVILRVDNIIKAAPRKRVPDHHPC
ncbi:insulinase family protein, partial [Bartonella sp. OD88NMGDW]|uniref:insulinase family protein n=1 Tax=Bartonella sp. OD88NMGDW TaxID=3243571 RepID=UPI0035D03F7B